MPNGSDPMVTRKRHRMITGAFGVFLLGIALLTISSADAASRLAAMALALVLAILGVDAMVSAIRGKASLVSRLGPLP